MSCVLDKKICEIVLAQDSGGFYGEDDDRKLCQEVGADVPDAMRFCPGGALRIAYLIPFSSSPK